MAGEKSVSEVYSGEYVSDSDNSISSFKIAASKPIQEPSAATSKQPVKWKEKEVIRLLEAVVQFQRENGDPKGDKAAYYSFIKEKLWEGVTRTQMYEKLRSLKRNYHRNKSKIEEGEKLRLSDYGMEVFVLCKNIWDSEKQIGKDRESNVKSGGCTEQEAVATNREDDIFTQLTHLSRSEIAEMIESFWKKYRHLYTSVDKSRLVVRDNLFMLGDEKGKELNNRWYELNMKAEKLGQQIQELQNEQIDLILRAIKRSL